jgi:Zn-dependent protease with chaperone function
MSPGTSTDGTDGTGTDGTGTDGTGTDSPRWRGRLHDGRTAASHPVEASLGADALEIAHPGGAALARWPYRGLVAIEPLRAGAPAVLAPDADDDARLTLAHPPAFDALVARAPQLADGVVAAVRRGAGTVALWGAAIAALLAALWFGWPELADGIASLISDRVQTHIGEQAREQILDRTKPCDVAEGRAALDGLMTRLVTAMHYDEPVTVTVIDLPIVNAVALPGNQILVFRQLITEAQSPEELAGVLAHEIGHLAARHPIRNLVRQFGLNMILMALSGSSNWDGVAQMLISSSYSRGFEAEADTRALDALEAAGIGGQGWVDFFDRHTGKNGAFDRAGAYLSSHPPSAERRDRALHLPPTKEPALSAGEWLVLRSICGTAPTRRPNPPPRP